MDQGQSDRKTSRSGDSVSAATAVGMMMLVAVVVGVGTCVIYGPGDGDEPGAVDETRQVVERIDEIDTTALRPQRAERRLVEPVDKEPAPPETERLDDDRYDQFRQAFRDHYDEQRRQLLHVTVDRPMYRPGQTVQWHIWRFSAQFGDPADGDELEVELVDPEGTVVEQLSTEADFQAAAGSFEIDEDEPGGQWTLQVVDDEEVLFERPLLVSTYEPPRFHQQVDFDHDAYRQGDEVSAQIEIRRDTGDPIAGADIEGYLQIGGAHIEDVTATLDAAGQAEIELTLPSTIDGDNASLVLTVDEGGMVETEVWPIELALDEVNVEFFAEGGELVEGLKSRVYFEATDLSGQPVQLEGWIVDDEGRVVERVESEHEGRGRFELTPEPGVEYSLKVDDADIDGDFELPSATNDGCVLRHYDDFDSVADSVRVAVWCTEEQTVGILGAMGDRLFDVARMDAGPDEPAVAYLRPDDGEWPRAAGVVRTTVVEDSEQIDVIADRVGFRGRRAQLDIDLEFDRDFYQPGDTAQLEVTVRGPDGQPENAEMVLAAVDDRIHTEAGHLDAPSILGQLLLVADDLHFWGDVQEADRYFDLYEETAFALELLMGTRGWREADERDAYYVDGGDVKLPPPPPRPRPRPRPQPRPQPELWDRPADTDDAVIGLGGIGRGGGGGADAALPQRPVPESQQRSAAVVERAAPVEQHAPAPTVADEVALDAVQESESSDAPGMTSPRFMRDDDAFAFTAWDPEVVAGSDGSLAYELQLPEAVGAYRVTLEGIGRSNMVGAAEAVVGVEAPLSAAVRMPEILSGGDRVDLPITVRNANDDAIEATVEIDIDGAASVDGEARFDVEIPAWSTATNYVPMVVDDTLGEVVVEVWTQGGGFSDGARREATIEPRGFERTWTASGQLPGTGAHEVPLMGMTDAGVQAELAIYPTPAAEALQGVESMARRPMGCFEQTSSRNHPNLLVWRHLKESGQMEADTEAMLRNHINDGYQRLVGFEADGGGFEWFGRGQGQAYLTAWGLVQFSMMAEIVDDFDRGLIDRSVQFLRRLADDDGGFNDGPRGAWQRLRGQRRRAAELFVVYGLARAGQLDGFEPQLRRAEQVAAGGDNAYEVALATAALLEADVDGQAIADAVDHLTSFQDADGAFRPGRGARSWAGGYGGALNVETTGLAAWALLKSGRSIAAASEAIQWLDDRKTGRSWWGSTQATVMALEARIVYERDAAGESEGPLTVLVDGRQVASKHVSADDPSPVDIDDLGEALSEEQRQVKVRSDVPVTYDLEATWRLEQFDVGEFGGDDSASPLGFAVDHVELEEVAMGDEIVLEATLVNTGDDDLGMSVIRLALPAGVEVADRQIDALVDRSGVDYYETTGREIVLYFDEFEAGDTESLQLSATADVPGVYEVPASVAYAYYRDESEWQWSGRGELEVTPPAGR